MIVKYIERRSTARCHATIIQSLKSAAEEAADRGDAVAALAFQREIDRLYQDLAENNQTYASPRPAPDGDQPAFNASLIALQWQNLPAGSVHSSKSACIIDCGDQGQVTITPRALSLSGEVLKDPKAIYLSVRHAQLNWKHGMRVHGSNEVKFKFAVAAKMAGVKVKGARIPWARRAEAEALIAQWSRELDCIRPGGQPSRPSVEISSGRQFQRPAFGRT